MTIDTQTVLAAGMMMGFFACADAALAKSNPFMEYAGDFGHSAGNTTADGVPDMVYRDFRTGEVVVIYMHTGMDRPLTPADLNATGEVFFGPGTIAAVDILDTDTEYDVSADVASITVDNWGTGGSGLDLVLEVAGPVIEIEVLDGGSGYHNSGLGYFDIDETGTGGSGLDLVYTTIGGTPGEVRKVIIVDGGSGYEPGAEIPILNSNLLGHPGDPFAGIAYANDLGVIDRLDVVERGSEFIDTPGIIFFPAPEVGSGAEFRGFLAGSIDSVLFIPSNPDAGGQGYASDPVLIPETDGIGFEYRMVRRGPIVGTTIINPGGGYVVAPQVAVGDLEFGGDIQTVLWDELDVVDRPATDVTGRVVVMDVDGTPVQLKDRRWNLLVGDVDADGDRDFVWRRNLHESNPERIQIWIMDGGTRVQNIQLDPPDLGWVPRKVADLDGDRDQDILWWNELTGMLAVWDIDPLAQGFVSDRSLLVDSDQRSIRWWPELVIPGSVGENDRIVWRDPRNSVLAIADYAERDLSQMLSWDVISDENAAAIVPGSDLRPWRVGDLNGDGNHTDLLLRNTSSFGVSMWQMDGSTLVNADDLTYGSRAVRAVGHPNGILTHGGERATELAFGDGGLAMLSVTSRAAAFPSSVELSALTDLLSQLSMAGDDTALFVLAEVLSLLNTTPSLVDYLLVPANATQLLGGLSDFMQHSIESEVAALAAPPVNGNALASSIIEYKHVAMSGEVSVSEPELQPLPEEDESDSSSDAGGGGSDSSGSGGSALPGGGSGSSGSGSGSLPGDTGGSGGGNSSGGIPDNFDPNDPDTWPAGIDTFEELLQWLIDNPNASA